MPDAMQCDTCGVLLNIMNGQYAHARQPDDNHPAAPVTFDATKAHYKCDFCGDVHADVATAHTLPANDFPDPLIPNATSRGGWCACPPCAELVEVGDWPAIVERAVAGLEPEDQKTEEMMRAWLRALHTRLQANTTGPLRPYKPGDENW